MKNRIILFSLLINTLANANYILHITDVHLDPEYYPGSPDNCLLGSTGLGCCREFDIGKYPFHKASVWGDYYCDDSIKLVNNTLYYISNTLNLDIDFIFFTGDIVHHHLFSETVDKNLNNMKEFYECIKINFPNTTVYPCLGNHDTFPLDQLASPSILSHFLTDFINDEWESWLDKNITTLKYGGYYTTLIEPGWRLVALNSLYHDSHNILISHTEDIAHQLSWLNKTLDMANKTGEIVWLIGHIAPSSGEATDYFKTNFKQIVEIYNNTLTYQFWGHEHKDKFIVYLNKKGEPFAHGLLSSSLMSDQRYPSFRLYEYDRHTKIINNYYHYRINLTATIKENKLSVEESYNALETYPIDRIDSDNLYQLATLFKTSKDYFNKYCDLYYDTPLKYVCNTTLINEIFV